MVDHVGVGHPEYALEVSSLQIYFRLQIQFYCLSHQL